MEAHVTRRDLIKKSGQLFTVGAAGLSSTGGDAYAAERKNEFIFSLNTSTIRGQKLSLNQEIDIASKAGYQAIEPWISEIDTYVQGGGSLIDLKNRLSDRGLSLESAISFFNWIVDDPSERKIALDEARRKMEMLSKIGGKRLAAPPAGATAKNDIPLSAIAERYRNLLEASDQFGVVPQAEIWGFSKTLTTLGETAHIAIQSGHPNACILPDVYHLYKGGSPFTGLAMLSGSAFHNFHINDYPSMPSREQIDDSYRCYPGDGIAPLTMIFKTLRKIGYRGALSIELFNRDYYKADPLIVAKTALDKLKNIIEKSHN